MLDANALAAAAFESGALSMPALEELGARDQHDLDKLLKDWKLTPATMAFKLENRRVPEHMPLKWYPSPHLLYISLKIATGIARGNARICISAPPRHGKSKLCTHYGPLWVLENFVNYHVALVTYGADLSTDFSREVRDSIEWNEDLLDVRLRQDASRLARFLTNKGGSMTSIGLGGPFTGRGAHVLFIDDYIKMIKEALSPTIRQQQWEWFTTTAMTRLEPGASVILIATRWHKDDLIGKIRKEFGDKWEYIVLPDIAGEDDILGRKVGEPLFPQRFDLEALAERKILLGTKFYDAIYRQQPHDDSEGFTQREWVTVVNEIPTGPMRYLRVWDMAGTESGNADYTAGGLFGLHIESKTVYLLNMIRKRMTALKVELKVKEVADLDGKDTRIVIEQESGSSGKAVIEHYKANVLEGFSMEGYYSNRHKLVKAQPFLAGMEAGRFKILSAGWNKDFIDEFESFPGEGPGIHDDQIDVCAIAWEKLLGKRKLPVAWGRDVISDTNLTLNERIQKLATLARERDARKARAGGHFGLVRGATFGR